jgi:hypothetical protein
VINGHDGKYIVKCDKTGYTITSENDKSVVRLDFDADRQEWSTMIDNQRYVFMTFIDDTHVKLPTPSGDYKVVTLDQEGVFAYEALVQSSNLALR